MSKHKRRKQAKPDKFEYLPVETSPASEGDAQGALTTFIQRFVERDKRSRAAHLLLNPAKRERGLQEVGWWLDDSKRVELEGSSRFPQHIAARLGDLPGIFIDSTQCVHVTAPQAAVLGVEEDYSIFVSSEGLVALLFAEIGCSTLCLDSPRRT